MGMEEPSLLVSWAFGFLLTGRWRARAGGRGFCGVVWGIGDVGGRFAKAFSRVDEVVGGGDDALRLGTIGCDCDISSSGSASTSITSMISGKRSTSGDLAIRASLDCRLERRGGVGGRRGGVGGRASSPPASSFSLSEHKDGVVRSVSVVAMEGQLCSFCPKDSGSRLNVDKEVDTVDAEHVSDELTESCFAIRLDGANSQSDDGAVA